MLNPEQILAAIKDLDFAEGACCRGLASDDDLSECYTCGGKFCGNAETGCKSRCACDAAHDAALDSAMNVLQPIVYTLLAEGMERRKVSPAVIESANRLLASGQNPLRFTNAELRQEAQKVRAKLFTELTVKNVASIPAASERIPYSHRSRLV